MKFAQISNLYYLCIKIKTKQKQNTNKTQTKLAQIYNKKLKRENNYQKNSKLGGLNYERKDEQRTISIRPIERVV